MTRMILFWKHLQDSPNPIIQENSETVKSLTRGKPLLMIHRLIKNCRSSR